MGDIEEKGPIPGTFAHLMAANEAKNPYSSLISNARYQDTKTPRYHA